MTPPPSAAEKGCAFLGEFLLEGIETAELRGDGVSQLSYRMVVGHWSLKTEKIQVVVQNLPGVVEDATFRTADNLLKAFAFILAPGNSRVQVVHIGLEMFAMVETDGLCADHWFQRISSIGEFYKFEWFHK